MWFPARGVLLILVLFAALGRPPLQLSAQAVAPATTEKSTRTATEPSTKVRRSASGAGIADPKLDAQVESLLHGMTLEEKIGQLSQLFDFGEVKKIDEAVAGGHVGSLLFVTDPAEINRFQHLRSIRLVCTSRLSLATT